MKQDIIQCFGFVDLQVNGAIGVDFSNPDSLNLQSLKAFCNYQCQTGVVMCYPTIVSSPDEVIYASLAKISEARKKNKLVETVIPGVHLEIYVSPRASGCHNKAYFRKPDWQFIESLWRCRRLIKLITLAPELPGSIKFIRRAVREGVRVGIGHTMASHKQILAACRAGVTFSTHLGNGIPGELPRNDNPIIAQLAQSQISATFIADLVHLPDFALMTYIAAKGIDRSIIVTDSISAAGMGDGDYSLAGQAITVAEGVARPRGIKGALAGSVTNMLQSFTNLVRCGFSTNEVTRMMCLNPRILFGLQEKNQDCFLLLAIDGDGVPAVRQVMVRGDMVVNN